MQVFNNLSSKLEDFQPLNDKQVYIYSCGPTVYDHSHIGHARSAITWDVLSRYLKFKGYEVCWMRNITNIDDKIINRATEMNVSPDVLSREFTLEFWKDMQDLNVSWPDFEPRATDYIPQMVNFIEGLIQKDHAYESNGDVYFRVHTHDNYGQLKKQSLEVLEDGLARVEQNNLKENHLDFALWKAFPEDKKNSFNSPWGYGRPGWHLECSTMIHSILSETYGRETLDIHAGGDDLMFPHHENECAQSEAFTGQPLAKYWMHNGMVMVNGTKMSKSLGNYMTIKEVLGSFKPSTVRYFSLSSHYKKQINFTNKALAAAESGFAKLVKGLANYLDESSLNSIINNKANLATVQQKMDFNQEIINEFVEAMDEDMSTSKVFSSLFMNLDNLDMAKAKSIATILDILGFDLKLLFTKSSSNSNVTDVLGNVVDILIDYRSNARANKDFKTSDEIRDSLDSAGITLKDHRDKRSEWDFRS